MSFVHPTKRYRLYFDETGTGDPKAHRKDSNQRYLSVTGLVFRQDAHDSTFTARVSAFKRRIFNDPNVVLHRREIMDRVGPFAALDDETLRAEFDSQFADLIEYLPGPAFTVSIDKEEHLQRYKVWRFDPYHYVLTCLVERFVLWLNRTGNRGDVMGEARGPFHDGRLRRAYRRLYVNGSSFIDRPTIQARLISRELRLEPKSANIAGLQVADLLAHPAHRTFKFIKLGTPLPNDYGASLIKSLELIYDRHPKSGSIEGCGRKWLP
jgi:uncharacterized protein DUF3800